MGRKLRHMLIFLLIMMKEPNLPEADCINPSRPVCTYREKGITSTGQVDIPTSVCHLELGNNRISSIPSLSNLSNLTYLDLGHNMLTRIQQGTFSNKLQLAFLDLASNKISSIQAGAFSNLPKLKTLYLAYNKLTRIQPGTFANLPELQHLHLRFNKIGEIQSEVFSNLPKLQILDLHSNKIRMIQAGAFSNISNVKKLHLGKNLITNIQSGTFANLNNLQYLNLQTNHISSLPRSDYDVFASIQMLSIGDNPWHCDCRMVPFKQIKSFIEQIVCAHPPNHFRQKLKDVHPKDLICNDQSKATAPTDKHAPFSSSPVSTSSPFGNTAGNITVSSKFANLSDDAQWLSAMNCSNSTNTPHNNWYFRRNVHSVSGTVIPDDTERKVPLNVTPTLPDNTCHESCPSLNQAVIISVVIGSLVTLSVFITFIVWCKKSGSNLLTKVENNKSAFNKPTVTAMTSDHDQAGQGQSQAITESNTNTTAMADVSGHDHQYEDVDNMKGQGRPQAITETKINTGAVAVSRHGHQYEDVDSQHNQTGQGTSQVITETYSNTTAAIKISSNINSLYGVMGPYQAITKPNTNTTVSE